MPQIGQKPGLSWITCGCMPQVQSGAIAFAAGALGDARAVREGDDAIAPHGAGTDAGQRRHENEQDDGRGAAGAIDTETRSVSPWLSQLGRARWDASARGSVAERDRQRLDVDAGQRLELGQPLLARVRASATSRRRSSTSRRLSMSPSSDEAPLA